LQLPALGWLILNVSYDEGWMYEFCYLPAVAAKLAGSTACAVFGTTSTPDGTADEAGASSTGAIGSHLSGLPR
jgi:hypothetical protein